jgi:microcystin-dependent protein
MADQFVGEIRVFPFSFAPLGWAMCNGQILPISQNTALFSLLGTFYGGDGKSNFALPNFQGHVAVSQGQGPGLSQYVIGETGGQPMVELSLSQIPAHTHTVQCAPTGNTTSPANAVFAGAPTGKSPAYAAPGTAVQMLPSGVTVAGGGQPHENRPPFLMMNFCIALQGIFPPRS